MTDFDFTFSLPDEWEDQTVYIFKGPKLGEIEHRLMVYLDRFLQHEDIDKLASEKTRPILENIQGLEVLKDEAVTIEGGNPAYEWVVKWVPADEIVVYKKYVFVIWNQMGFTFCCDFSKKSYKALQGQLKHIVESLVPGTFDLK